jgi:hypothetical protein
VSRTIWGLALCACAIATALMLVPQASPQQLPWVTGIAVAFLVAAMLVGVVGKRNRPGMVLPEKPWPRPAHVEAFVNSVKFGGKCPVCGLPGSGPTRDWTPCDKHRDVVQPCEMVRTMMVQEETLARASDAVNGHVAACDAEQAMAREEYRSDFGRDV